jgi:hypothetical protein
MADFKDLSLDTTKIEAAVHGFADGRAVTGPKVTDKFTEFSVDGGEGQQSCTIQIFEKKATGKVTLHFKVGKNHALSEQLAQHVANVATRAVLDPKLLALKQISEEHWSVLIDLLKEESGLTVAEETIQHGVRFRVSLNAVDQVLIHRYKTGSFQMQGKQYSVYGKVVDILSSMSGEREAVIVAQLEMVQIKGITSASLMEQLTERLPCTCKAVGETAQFILAPSIAFSKFEIDLPDYSSFTHAALRGLEACMKHLLSAHGFVAKAQEGMNHFFDKASQTLKPEFSGSITCSQTIGALHDFYKLYAKDRNALFHADGTPETSRLIEKRGEAVGIIDSVLITLEKGFRAIETGKGYA